MSRCELKQGEPSVDQTIRLGMDSSKYVSQLHGVNAAEQPILRKKMRRCLGIPSCRSVRSSRRLSRRKIGPLGQLAGDGRARY
ncbi:hypothetical protein BMJ34_23330 [Sinorhizobium medicae]|uniref:Transposase n=1 Tax=Sinorhizobium medicae TaxID=110321 RepID=A0ABX4TQC9_9HYPH|nr:hypothetical protein BMJ34_23330 [Sinorhizobium medicae]PLU06267.1 hypothetical protein BMJ33_06865 [Sinorhizobium medicae]PLU14025.1 hypothetical protein BMJ30_24405 [Sinorhizobium medicae]PLU18872.1 hypothetical protein BMJ29_17420 [Sinorhizobium medicae]